MKVSDCHRWPWRHTAGATLKLGIKHFVAAYLMLCLAFAGAVGLSPVLHQWVEHAGEGRPHVHGPAGHFHHGSSPAGAHVAHDVHGDHSHSHPHPPGRTVRTERLFVHSEGAFPTVDVLVVRAWQSLREIFAEGDSSESNEGSGEGEHHHESLAALLTSGVVDCADPVVEFLPPHTGSFVAVPFPNSRLLAFDWSPVAAPRAPPRLHG